MLMHRVVFVCSSGLHVRLFSSTMNELEACKIIEPLIISLDTYYDGIHGDVARTVGDERLVTEIRDLPISRSRCRFRIGYLLQTFMSIFTFERRCLEGRIRALSPKVIVLGNDTGHVERAIIRVAKKIGIITVLLQDGFIFDEKPSRSTNLVSRLKTSILNVRSNYFGGVMYGMGGCDIIFSSGEYWKSLFVSRIKSSKQVVEVVGSPLFDQVTLKKKTKVNSKKRIVTYFCTNFLSGLSDQAAHQYQIDEILSLKRFFNERMDDSIVFVAKLHPADSVSYFQQLVNEVDDTFDVDVTKGFVRQISESWLCMTNFSSVYFYALAAEKLCVLSKIGIKSNKKYVDLVDSLRGFNIENIDELSDVLDKLEDDRCYMEKLQLLLNNSRAYVDNSNEGMVAKTIADKLIDLASLN